MKLPAVRKRVRMIDVEQQLPLHRPIGDDARRHALAQSLAHQIAAVGEPLKRVVGHAIHPEHQERIEAVQHIAQRRIELEAGGRERAQCDREIDELGVGHVVGAVFREARMEQDLGMLRVVLPDQTHVYGFRTLHGYQR